MGVGVFEVSQTNLFQQIIDPFLYDSCREFLQAKGYVAVNGEMRKEGIVLKYHPRPSFLRGDKGPSKVHTLTVQPDMTPFSFLETGDGSQNGGLATAARTQQAAYDSFGQGHGKILNDGTVAVGHIQILDLKNVIHQFFSSLESSQIAS